MVRMIRDSGCEYDLLKQLQNIGIYDCQNLSDIDYLKKTYPSQLEGKRTEEKTNANSAIQILEQQREEILTTYTQGFDKIVGWFKRISPSIQIFSQRNQLQRSLNRIDHQEHHLNTYFQTNKETIIGAHGEIRVIRELQSLPDEYILINDYKIEFS